MLGLLTTHPGCPITAPAHGARGVRASPRSDKEQAGACASGGLIVRIRLLVASHIRLYREAFGTNLNRVDPILTDRRFNSIPVRFVIDTSGKVKFIHFISSFPD